MSFYPHRLGTRHLKQEAIQSSDGRWPCHLLVLIDRCTFNINIQLHHTNTHTTHTATYNKRKRTKLKCQINQHPYPKMKETLRPKQAPSIKKRKRTLEYGSASTSGPPTPQLHSIHPPNPKQSS